MRSARFIPTAALALAGLALQPVAAEEAAKPAPAADAAKDQKAQEAVRTSKEAVAPLEALSGIAASVTLRHADAPLTDVLKELQEQTQINFVATPEVTGDVRVKDVNLVDIPWRDALKALLVQTEAVIEEETPRMIRIGRPPRVTMDFRDAPIGSVLDTIAKVSGANLIIASQVQGKVTGRFRNIPWNAALDNIVKTAGFSTVREDQGQTIIRVVDPKTLQAQLDTRPYQLRFLRPPPKYTGQIRSPYAREAGGAQAAQPSAGGPEADLARFTLLNIIRNFLTKDAAGKEVGSLNFDRDTNTLIVTDTKPVLDKIDDLVKLLDVEPLQVLIDVNFVSTRNEDLATLGTNFALGTDEGWTFTTGALPVSSVPSLGSTSVTRQIRPFETSQVADSAPAGLGAGRVTSLPFGFGRQRQSSDQLFLTKYDFISTLRVFKKDQFSKVVQRPQLSTLNNQEATIFVGEEIHYASTKSSATQAGGATFELSEAQNSPVKVGFQLLIIPNIIPNTQKVILTVIPQNEALSGDPSTLGGKIKGFERFQIAGLGPGGSTLTIDLPRIRSATVVTRMLVESGQTAVIGGLVQDDIAESVTKIPLLGDIPVLGWLFKQKSDTVIKENLFIFITARLVRPSGETKAGLAAQLRQRGESESGALDALRRGDKAAEDAVQRQLDERKKQMDDEFKKMEQAK